MPSTSAAQHRWIEWLRHDPAALHKSGMSQAKADEWAKADTGSPWKHRDDGGAVDPGGGIGGVAPNAQNQNPIVQGQIQQYASLPTEKLQEIAARLGGSPQGAMVQRIISQRHAMPQAAPLARGGTVRRAIGGGMTAMPSWTKLEARGENSSGFLHGTTPGRADSVQTAAPPGAYVIPADVIAGLGEGNSLAGARVADQIFGSGPHGITQARSSPKLSAPRPPPAFRESIARGGPVKIFPEKEMARGGSADATPVKLSHGEYVVGTHHVLRLGQGDLKTGHRILDKWVETQRKKQIEKLKSLPGPVKS